MDIFIAGITGKEIPIPVNDWEQILSEYLIVSNNQQAKQMLSIKKELYKISGDIHIIQLLVNDLHRMYSNETAAMLRRYFRLEFNAESYVQDLSLAVTQTKTKVMQRDRLQQELDELDKNIGSPPTAQDYITQLSHLAKFQGVAVIHPNQITIAEYCALLLRFTQANKP